MSYKPRWDNGGWNVICDACGRKFKETELQLRWDGLMVCRGDWEPRQSQDFVKGVADIQAPKWVRPEQEDQFIPIHYDKYPEDSMDLSEAYRKAITKVIGDVTVGVVGTLNGSPLDAYYLNYTADGTNPERITITEAYQVILGRTVSDALTLSESTAKRLTKVLSDSATISESVRLVETEQTIQSLTLADSVTSNTGKGVVESLTISESVATVLVSPPSQYLNGAALNSTVLD